MTRIQAVVASQVPVYPAGSTVTVAVLDTGGTQLADLNSLVGLGYSGGKKTTVWQDGHGHGTHVAGTISGRNQGAGVFGVVPGIRVLPIKILSDAGSGSTSDIMLAIEYVATNAAAQNIVAINLSLGGSGNSADPMCTSIQAAVNAGVIVAVAAGNENSNLVNSSPAACNAAVTVTAIDASSNLPASFSNYLSSTAVDSLKRRVISAPGVDIRSTLPDGTYEAWSGTSMATPHVAGVAARCFLAGPCKLSQGAQNTQIFLDAVWAKHNADTAYRWSSNGLVSGTKYFGPLVWAAKW